jgi:DNA-binding transcriptional regulator YdaS (Cro superfamily)
MRTLPRLSPSDLAVLGRYVFGNHGWQTALARELGCSRQMVVYWLSGARLVSEKRSRQIAAIARARHDRRVVADQSAYVAMAGGLSSSAAKAMMLSMLAGEVDARLSAMAKLSDAISVSAAKLAYLARGEVLLLRPEPADIEVPAIDVLPVSSSSLPLSVTAAAEVATWRRAPN